MSSEQSITIVIAGTQYPLKAASPEVERLMRIAAETVNTKLAAYDAKYPNKSTADKLAFVALNETVSRLVCQKHLDEASSESAKLQDEIETYLKNIDE
jgi:hypothetical protein